jgi:glucose-1-phosphate cytidylyltransferase
LGTLTAVRPPSRFGELNIGENDIILNLEEKPQMGRGLINGGFFVFDRKMFSYLTADEGCDFEFGPLQQIAKESQLKAFMHEGFWQCMDNIRERDYLDKQVKDNIAPWMVWE